MRIGNVLLAALACGVASPVAATLLPNFSDNVPLSAYTGGGTLVASSSGSAITGTFAGTLTSAVYRTSSGTLDFAYQYSVTGPGSAGVSSVERLSFYDFDGFLIDAEYSDSAMGPFIAADDASGPGIMPTANRADGTVGINFSQSDRLAVGDTSSIFIFKTNARDYISGTAQASDGSVMSVASFAPGAVPEVSTWVQLLAGFGATGGMLRKRRNLAGIAA